MSTYREWPEMIHVQHFYLIEPEGEQCFEDRGVMAGPQHQAMVALARMRMPYKPHRIQRLPMPSKPYNADDPFPTEREPEVLREYVRDISAVSPDTIQVVSRWG